MLHLHAMPIRALRQRLKRLQVAWLFIFNTTSTLQPEHSSVFVFEQCAAKPLLRISSDACESSLAKAGDPLRQEVANPPQPEAWHRGSGTPAANVSFLCLKCGVMGLLRGVMGKDPGASLPALVHFIV